MAKDTPRPSSPTTAIPPAELMRLGRAYHAQGRLREAAAAYERVLQVYPKHAETLAEAGLVAFRLGQGERAVKLLRQAVAAKHDLAPAHGNLAIILRATGKLLEAEQAARRAIRFDPGLVEAHVLLGEILAERGDTEGARGALVRTLELAPGHGRAHYQLGLVQQQEGALDAAIESFEAALAAGVARAEIHYSLGTALHATKRLEEALAAYRQALKLQPKLLDGLFEVGKPRHIHAMLEQRDNNAALAELDRYLQHRPGQSCALALKAIVLDELGDRPAARHLVDFDRLIRPHRFAAAPGFPSVAALNTALAAHIVNHPTLRDTPSSFSASGGQTTGELLVPPKGPIAAFEQMVKAAVEDYIRNLPEAPDHPFVTNVPKRWRLQMWANILVAESFQVPHIHPTGWLSSAYYVSLPDVVRRGEADRAGWIEFGEPYRDIAHERAPELRAYRPEEGMLLLFPSYFYHRTLPFQSNEPRISIAFDVVPVA